MNTQLFPEHTLMVAGSLLNSVKKLIIGIIDENFILKSVIFLIGENTKNHFGYF